MSDNRILKTAVCISGKLSMLENYDNIRQHIIEPYNADVFIDTWIPFNQNTMKVSPKPMDADSWKDISIFPEHMIDLNAIVTQAPVDINVFVSTWKPRLINMEYFDAMPLIYQIRRTLPKNTMTYSSGDSPGTIVENVMFMFYKIWKCNQLRKFYEQINRIRYDRIIRLRFDNTFDSYPVIMPEFKTVYIPNQADHMGGICDQHAIADPQTMDLYCDIYNELYRYVSAGIGIHPESILRKHLEINRIRSVRFECGMKLRGMRA